MDSTLKSKIIMWQPLRNRYWLSAVKVVAEADTTASNLGPEFKITTPTS